MKPYEYYETIEKPISIIFQQMSNRGICIDLAYVERLKLELEAQFLPLDEEIKNRLGVSNVNSDKQVIEALDKRFGLRFTLKGKPTRSKVALARMQGNEIVDLLLQHSELGTLLDTFVYQYLDRGESTAHCFFNQCGTRTGRLSCSSPNLLQIPKRGDNGLKVRKMFIPRSGMQLGDCDFGQIEPRVLAHLSKDPNMLRMFNDGVDFHTFTADKLGIDRQRAKVLNLSVGYLASYKSVSQQLKCSDSEAQNEIDKWWALFPTLRRWQEKLIFDSKRSGYCTTLLGRRIKVDSLNDYNKWKSESAQRQLINNITQGSAAEIMKKAMIRIDYLFHHIGLLVQVYDELLFESEAHMIDVDLKSVKGCMENAVKLDVPLVVDAKIGSDWGSVHDIT